MRWPWQRWRPSRWEPPARIPDGDTVLAPGQRRWADLLSEQSESTGANVPVASYEPAVER